MIEFYTSMTDIEPMKCEFDIWKSIEEFVFSIENWMDRYPTGKIVLYTNHKTTLICLK